MAKVKFSIIQRFKDKYSISEMCRFFKVSRSGYYSYVCRQRNPEKDLWIAEKIKECQEKSKSTYGYRRVHIWLSKHGIKRNPKTVLRIMNKYNLLSQVRRRKAYKRFKTQLHKYPNLLDRNFKATKPNEKWVTDISYIHTNEGVLYLSMIRDLYDNSIVAYKTGTEQTVNLVLETIKLAKRKEVTANVQLHSDQGFQYTSNAYFHLTKEYNITPSMSRRGNCYDNAKAENFFGILKAECINRKKITTYQEGTLLIRSYIDFYNHERIQLKTMLTPLELRNSYYNNLVS